MGAQVTEGSSYRDSNVVLSLIELIICGLFLALNLIKFDLLCLFYVVGGCLLWVMMQLIISDHRLLLPRKEYRLDTNILT